MTYNSSFTFLASRNFVEILGETTDEVIGSVCDIACLLLGHHSREIVQSALSLVHVLMSGYGDIMTGKFLPNLVSFVLHIVISMHIVIVIMYCTFIIRALTLTKGGYCTIYFLCPDLFYYWI